MHATAVAVALVDELVRGDLLRNTDLIFSSTRR
jgi:hypothetical protein